MDFGCFVELMGFQKKAEGLVHLSNISATKRAGSAKDMVGKGEHHAVWTEGGCVLGKGRQGSSRMGLAAGRQGCRTVASMPEGLHPQHVLALQHWAHLCC